MVQKNKEENMKGKMDCKKMFSTCLEDPRCAEMMQKLMDRKGCPDCEGIMKSMMENFNAFKTEKKGTDEEKSHD
jgi:hypothetical protein